MKRYAREKREPYVLRKQKVELTDNKFKLRVLLTVLFAIIAVVSITLGIRGCLNVNDGVQHIEVRTPGPYNEEYSLYYNLGKSDKSATAEKKELSLIYSDIMIRTYTIFSSYEKSETIHNVKYINSNVNKTVTVEEELYNALVKLDESSMLSLLYMAPIYKLRSLILYSSSHEEAASYDPLKDNSKKELYDNLLSFITSTDHINLELLGNNQVKLNVSNEYIELLDEYFDDVLYISFMYLESSFIVDVVADALIEKGFNNGYLQSYDGVKKIFLKEPIVDYNIYDNHNNSTLLVGSIESVKNGSYVELKSFSRGLSDSYDYYKYADGSIVSKYIKYNDYTNTQSCNMLLSYSENTSCSDVLLSIIDIYLSDSIDASKLDVLAENGVYSCYLKDCVFNYNEQNLDFKFGSSQTLTSNYSKQYFGK